MSSPIPINTKSVLPITYNTPVIFSTFHVHILFKWLDRSEITIGKNVTKTARTAAKNVEIAYLLLKCIFLIAIMYRSLAIIT
jgi:hypothetical protein